MDLRALVLLAALALPAQLLAATANLCERCSTEQVRVCAAQTALMTPGQHHQIIWVLDISGDNSRKFSVRLFPPGAAGQPHDPADIHTDPATLMQALAVPEELSTEEAEGVAALRWWVNSVQGGLHPSRIRFQCADSDSVAAAPSLDETGTEQTRTLVWPKPIPVATESFASAYEVAGCLSCDKELSRVIEQHAGGAFQVSRVLSFIGRIVESQPLAINIEFRLLFADGSSGVWARSPRTRGWAAIDGTLRDGEGNIIPVHRDDVVPGMLWVFSQGAWASSSARFLDRLDMLGVAVQGPQTEACSVRCAMHHEHMLCTDSPCGS